MKHLIAAALVMLAAGCTTLGGNPLLADPVVKNDLASATSNVNNAVKLGLLPADDPAVTCLNAVAAKAAADVSFTPEVNGLISAGSVAYIAAQLAKKGVNIDPACEALVGRVVIDGTKAAAKALPLVKGL